VKIGESGWTGTSLQHLHFGVKVTPAGNFIDPYGYDGEGNLWINQLAPAVPSMGMLGYLVLCLLMAVYPVSKIRSLGVLI
jgi:hypothetical protein